MNNSDKNRLNMIMAMRRMAMCSLFGRKGPPI